ncbi:hypothetical protein RUND412_006469 [Rhizina undulata]
MTSKIIPSNPSKVMVIRYVTPNITTLSVPFLRYGKIKFGGRGAIIRLRTGSLVVFSPVALTPEVKSTLENLGGKVSYLIAPDREHHIFLGQWKKEFSQAKVLGPEGLYEKRLKQGNEDVRIDYEFTRENKHAIQLPAEITDEFEIEYFDGHANKEIAFLHKPDRTLIEADLLFNLYAHEQYCKSGEDPTSGVWTKIMHYFTNIHGKGQQRFIWYAAAKDKVSFAESARRVAGWEFDKIIPCHGDVVESRGNEVFRRIFAWHL